MNKIYTLQEIDDLINKYKKTYKQKYLSELFKAFEGFIVKYAYFLKYGKCHGTDRDLIGLKKLLTCKGGDDPVFIITKIFEIWEYNDIINELNILFIKSVNIFTKRKEGPFFTGYLYNYYKYMVKEWIEKVSQDAMNYINRKNLDELNCNDQMFLQEKDIPKYENFCLTEKTVLTQLEKNILYLHYGKKISIANIAKMFGINRSYANLLKKTAKDKLMNSGITFDDFEK